MPLPLQPPLQPQLARSKAKLPEGDWSYEPKWDGFRAIVFVDNKDVTLLSRGGKPLERYFPELAFPSGRYVIDGEIIIDARDADGNLLVAPESNPESASDLQIPPHDFELLSQRIHPAASRIEKLSQEIPARFVAFDFLADGDEVLLDHPFSQRRERLVGLINTPEFASSSASLTPATVDASAASEWLQSTEGVIAKELDAPYVPGSRKSMFKIKRLRTIDCVVVGWREGKEPGTVGSLILGLYDGDELRVVGHTSGLKAAEKTELVQTLAPYASGDRGSADENRWSGGKDLSWTALRPELVVEITVDHIAGGRMRNGAKLLRWRDDKPAAECLIDQLDS